MAELSIEEGRLRDAEASVREAREVFRKHIEDEVHADTVLARALLTQGKSAEAQKEIDAAMALFARVQNQEVRLKLALAAAAVRAASDGSAGQAEALRSLTAALADANRCGYVG